MRLPFGKRDLVGYAVNILDELPPEADVDESKLKDLIEVLDEDPLITPEILNLTKWTADYYASFWGEMLKASLPAGINSEKVRPKLRKAVRRVGTRAACPRDSQASSLRSDAKSLTDQQQRILDLLDQNGGEMLWTDVQEMADVGASPINTLAKRGLVEIYVQDLHRDPLADVKLPEIT